MKAVVEDTCIGCGLCVDLCPEVFEMVDEETVSVKVDEVPEDQADCARSAAEDCPVEAISIEDVASVGAAPPIDALIVVTDD